MNKLKIIKIGFIVIAILIILPLIYLAYDRSIMPPKPDWEIPAFTPDPENTPKIDWLRGKGNNYFLNWLESHKENNALIHYIDAFSSLNISEEADRLIGYEAQDRWNKPFPEVEKAIQLNQKALNEVRLGAQLRNCEFPPNPYSYSGPILNFILTRKLARLMSASGRQMEYEKKYSEALQYYMDGMQFGKDIAPKDQSLVTHMVSIAIINIQLFPTLELINADKLSEKDLKQIIAECARIEKEQATLANAIEIGYRKTRTTLEKIKSLSKELSFNGKRIILQDIYYYFNKGHVLHNYAKYNEEIINALASKPYREYMQVDWKSIMPKDRINRIYFVANWSKAFTQNMREICLLRLAQVDSAIRLYHRQKNQWPKSLDDLKPDYLTEVPLDPFINQPFKLAKDETGMFAYSVGPDFKDDSAKIIYGTDTADYQLGDIK